MEYFTEGWEVVDPTELSDDVRAAVAELTENQFEIEVLDPATWFPLEGPILRVKVTTHRPSRPAPISAELADEEYVLLGDWRGHPATPPAVRFDRFSFPRNLPHINQTRKSSPVWPCLTSKPLSWWDEGRTVTDLVRRVERWLADACAGRLMAGDALTFEPIFIAP